MSYLKQWAGPYDFVVIEQYGIFRLKKIQLVEEHTFLSFLFPFLFKPKRYHDHMIVNGIYGGMLHFKSKEEAFEYIPKLEIIFHSQKH